MNTAQTPALPGNPSLCAFPLIRDAAGCVLLAHRIDGDAWYLPGGGVEPFESPWVTFMSWT